MSDLHDTVIASPGIPRAEPGVAWFCLRSHPKHEHIAAQHLRRMENVEVCNPQVRYTRSTRRGPVVVTEAMFPTYLFARFDWRTSLNRVHFATGVSGIVHFGDEWPTVPPSVIAEIRRSFHHEELCHVANEPQIGEEVEIAEGAFRGIQAIITRVMPGSQRVLVLLELMGRHTAVELSTTGVIRKTMTR